MGDFKRIDQLLESLNEDAPNAELGHKIGDVLRKKYPVGKLSYETANEFVRYQGLLKSTVKATNPITMELQFEEDMPMGPEDTARQRVQDEFNAKHDAALEDWREFLSSDIQKVAEQVNRDLEVTDVKTPYADTAVVTIERKS